MVILCSATRTGKNSKWYFHPRTLIEYLLPFLTLCTFYESADKTAGTQLWFQKRPAQNINLVNHLLIGIPSSHSHPPGKGAYISVKSLQAQHEVENRRSKAGGLGWEVPQFYRWGRNSNCVNFNISLFFMWHRKLEYWEIKTGTETLKISINIDYGFGVGNFLVPSSIAEKGSSPHMLSRSFWSCTQEVSLLCFQSVCKWPSTYP